MEPCLLDVDICLFSTCAHDITSSLCSAPAGRAEHADALTDETPELLWHWEVRDTKIIGKALRPTAVDCKKRLQQVPLNPP